MDGHGCEALKKIVVKAPEEQSFFGHAIPYSSVVVKNCAPHPHTCSIVHFRTHKVQGWVEGVSASEIPPVFLVIFLFIHKYRLLRS